MELIATPKARQHVKAPAAGAPNALLACCAKAALARMD